MTESGSIWPFRFLFAQAVGELLRAARDAEGAGESSVWRRPRSIEPDITAQTASNRRSTSSEGIRRIRLRT